MTGTNPHGCTCRAGEFGDEICKHRAKFLYDFGLLELESEPEPEPPAAAISVVPEPRPCWWCNATGRIPDDWRQEYVACSMCGGSGVRPTPQPAYAGPYALVTEAATLDGAWIAPDVSIEHRAPHALREFVRNVEGAGLRFLDVRRVSERSQTFDGALGQGRGHRVLMFSGETGFGTERRTVERGFLTFAAPLRSDVAPRMARRAGTLTHGDIAAAFTTAFGFTNGDGEQAMRMVNAGLRMALSDLSEAEADAALAGLDMAA